ncbi:MAG: helix-turn-helix domain-containing protein, partial [Chloroflexi bacterium]|nr:helix-turn-helix domain-containing protein [Chloroflexota bacterium]
MPDWMLYGAYGYTGELTARAAVARGHRPLLAGRSREKLEPLAEELGYTAHGYISELENGKKSPSVNLVLRVARRFDVSTDALLNDELDL